MFKLESDTTFTIKQGSKLGLSATYDEKRRDMAFFAWAWTDLDDDHTQILGYDAIRSPDETHVKLMSDTEHAIEYNRSRNNGWPETPGTIGTGIKFNDDVTFHAGTWYFVLAAPEAEHLGISIGLDLDRELSIAGEDEADTGTILPEDAFDGTAQAYSAPAGGAAASVQATATAPPGTRAFSTLFLDSTPAIGATHYGVDGPGDADDEHVAVSVLRQARLDPWAAVMAGPPGNYTHWVDAKAWVGPESYADQHQAVLYAAPIPF